MTDPKKLQIAVALVVSDEKRLLLSWNAKWEAFSLPMSKQDADPPAETPVQAAVRAAAEVLHFPARLVPGGEARATRALQRSAREGELKDYVYTVVPVEVHPDFRGTPRDGQPLIWAAVDKLLAGEYHPLTTSVRPILVECREWGWL